jgi:hypothetical protein
MKAPWLAMPLVLAGCAREPRATPAPVAPAAPAAIANSWTDMVRDANAAVARKDFRACREKLVALYDASGSSSILFDLAVMDAKVGDRDMAFSHLSTLAAMGLDADVTASPSLSALKDDARWPALRAQLDRARVPVAQATTAFALPHEDLVAEGVAWDPRGRMLLVSSVRERKILAVDEHGAATEFVPPGAGGVGALCGLATDGERLWVTMATFPPMLGFDAKGPRPTALLAYDLATRALRTRVDLPVGDGRPHGLTDLAVGPHGDVYVSDSAGGMVYALPPGASRLDPIVEVGALQSPQTPAVAADGQHLYIPDYARGIAVLDLSSRALAWLTPDVGVATDGIDDLHEVRGNLIAIQNGVTPPRIVRFVLDGTHVRRAEVLERAAPGLGDPTHGVVRDGALWFIASAGWSRFDDDGAPRKDAPPDLPSIMTLPLGGG